MGKPFQWGSLSNGRFIKWEVYQNGKQKIFPSLLLMATGEKLQTFLTVFGNLGV